MSNTWIKAQSLSSVFFCLGKTIKPIVIASWAGFLGCASAAEPISVQDYIALGLQGNQQLQSVRFQVVAAQQALKAARAAYRPSLSFEARYLRSEGGRTINFPIGDALNPVYRTLNGLTAGSANASQFPSIENIEFDLLRSHEQDTHLKLGAPLYAPQLDAAIEAADARANDASASREIYARTLVRDIRRAYSGFGQATAAMAVLKASETLLMENLRVNAALVRAGSATRDRELRANAELLAVQDRLQSSENAVALAARYLNFLVNRPLDAPTAVPILSADQHLTEANSSSALRPELTKLDANLSLAHAGLNQAAAANKPTLSFGVDAGTQGENYGFGAGKNLATAAIVLNWRFFDFGQTRAQKSAAEARISALQSERIALMAQLELAAKQSRDELVSAAKRITTAQARQAAAEEGFRILARKRDAGAATQIEFLDAERARTEAVLALDAARFDQANQLAELELALAAYPLGPEFSQFPR
jgi:outer membrane protein